MMMTMTMTMTNINRNNKNNIRRMSTSMTLILMLTTWAVLLAPSCWSFVIAPTSFHKGVTTITTSPPTTRSATSSSRLYGISEWRDLMFDYDNDAGLTTTSGSNDDRRLAMEDNNTGPPKSVCILPFPYQDVLLQGETKQLRLYEDRFIQLFDTVMTDHEGVVAMGLLASSGIIQTVPLCQVEAYNRIDGFGIFVTIRVVSRAQLLNVIQQEPYIKAVCVELNDKFPPNLEIPNRLADTIEDAMITLSALEHTLDQVSNNNDNKDNDLLPGKKEQANEEMERRIAVARLDDRFFDDDLGDDDENDNDDDDLVMDRRRRFQRAYRIALDTDTQGYISSPSATAAPEYSRSPKELAAVSWAAYMTDFMPEQDATFRIQAMDETDILERLKLASYMLREKRDGLQKQLEIVTSAMKKKNKKKPQDENTDDDETKSS